MTVSDMDTLLKQLLGDPNSYKWDQTNARLPALNVGQRQLVMDILGFAIDNHPPFDLLLGLQATSNINVATTGYALSGLDTTPGPVISESGFISASVTLNSVTYDIVHRKIEAGGAQRNYYLAGHSLYPTSYFFGGNYYIEIDTDDYPSTVTFRYVRSPKTLVISSPTGYQVSTCELSSGLHDLVVSNAEAECRRMADDFEQYKLIREKVLEKLKLMITGSRESAQTKNITQVVQ